jgi:hypothetical protein
LRLVLTRAYGDGEPRDLADEDTIDDVCGEGGD